MARGYVNGDDVVGPVVLTARSKDVQLTGFTQALNLSVERGDIELRPGKVPTGKMDVTTRSGHIELALPDGAKFNLRAVVQKGEMQNDFGSQLTLSNDGRGATLTGGVGDGPQIALNTDRGSVTVRKATGTDAIAPLPPLQPRVPRPPGHGRDHDKAKVEDIVERHADRLEKHLESIGAHIDRKAQDLERSVNRHF